MYAQRIERMRAQGLVTDAQAEALKASLSPLAQRPGDRRRRSRFALVLVMAAITAIVLMLILVAIYGSGADPAATEIQKVSETLNVPGGTGVMNRTLTALTSFALLSLPVILIIAGFAWVHNGIVDKEERVFQAWSQVESNLQRRTDLIPNIVETVGRYMRHERETLSDLTDQRSDAYNPLADATNELIENQQRAAEEGGAALDDEDSLARLAEAQQILSGSVRNLMAVVESYPSLRSGDQFLSLQAQLEGTENRINVARIEFNRSVGDYNSAIRRLPGTLIASLGGFTRKAYFEAEGDARNAVELELDGE